MNRAFLRSLADLEPLICLFNFLNKSPLIDQYSEQPGLAFLYVDSLGRLNGLSALSAWEQFSRRG